MITLTPELVKLVLEITGMTQLVKNFIPEAIRNNMKWWITAIIPVLVGGCMHFIDPSIAMRDGFIAGVLTALGYKAQTATVANTYGNIGNNPQ
jgi:hypothetical protein